MKIEDIFTIVGGITLVILTAVGWCLLLAFPTVYFWNRVMPDLFGLTTITWDQALCLCLLARTIWGTDSSSRSKNDV